MEVFEAVKRSKESSMTYAKKTHRSKHNQLNPSDSRSPKTIARLSIAVLTILS